MLAWPGICKRLVSKGLWESIYPVEASCWSGTLTADIFSYLVFTFQSLAFVFGSLEILEE